MFVNIKVVTRASKNEVVEQSRGVLMVRVTVAPEKGKANRKVVELLAEYFKVSKSSISIIKGEHNSRKTVDIQQKL